MRRRREKKKVSEQSTEGNPRGDISMWYLYTDVKEKSWKVAVSLGYTPALFSKNRAFGVSSNGQRVFTSHSRKAGHKKILGALSGAVNILRGMDSMLVPRKTWISITVMRPNDGRDCDPINFVDSICDAVKEVMGVDDRWFSVVVDWMDSNAYPDVQIEVYQGKWVSQGPHPNHQIHLTMASEGVVRS